MKQKPKTKQKIPFNPAEVLLSAGDDKTPTDVPGKSVLFRQGDPADSIFYVQKGRVKLTVLSKQGKEAVIALLGKGDFFGEGCLAGQLMRMSTAITLSDCSVIRLKKSTMIRV